MYESDERLTNDKLQDNVQSQLMGELIDCTLLEGTCINTFEDAGIMTYNKSLVICTPDGSEFQLTIVKSH